MNTREEEWRALLQRVVVDRSLISGGIRLLLKRPAGTKEELERLVALEKSCCAWIRWQLREETSSLLVLDATAELQEGAALLREWFAPLQGSTSG